MLRLSFNFHCANHLWRVPLHFLYYHLRKEFQEQYWISRRLDDCCDPLRVFTDDVLGGEKSAAGLFRQRAGEFIEMANRGLPCHSTFLRTLNAVCQQPVQIESSLAGRGGNFWYLWGLDALLLSLQRQQNHYDSLQVPGAASSLTTADQGAANAFCRLRFRYWAGVSRWWLRNILPK